LSRNEILKLRPITHLDVGCGRGGFLVKASEVFPKDFFIGVDINTETVRILSEKLTAMPRLNTKIVCAEAFNFISNHIQESSIDHIHIYFPTPYIGSLKNNENVKLVVNSPLMSQAFFRACRKVLRESGTIRIASDHKKTFLKGKQNAEKSGFTSIFWHPPLPGDDMLHLIGTGCERDMVNMGRETLVTMLV